MPHPETHPGQGTQEAIPSPETTQNKTPNATQQKSPHQEASPNTSPAGIKVTVPEYLMGNNLEDTVNAIVIIIDPPEGTQIPKEQVIQTADNFNLAFRKQYEVEGNKLTQEKRKRMVDWVKKDESEEGQHLLSQAAKALTEMMGKIKRKGFPGQDRYHMLEDLRTAVLSWDDYSRSGKSDGFYKIAALPQAFHDLGRLLEESIDHKTTGGEAGHLHAKLSGWLLNSVLAQFPDIPNDIHNQLVYGALAHQEWNPNKDEMTKHFTTNEPISQEVQKVERMGLVGPLAIERMIAYDVGAQEGKPLDFVTKLNPERKVKLDPKTNTDLFHHIEFYMRNLFSVEVTGAPEEVNKEALKRVDDLKAVSGAFLWLASTDAVREQIFAPEMAAYMRGQPINTEELTANLKKPLTAELWAKIMGKVREAEANPAVKGPAESMHLGELVQAMANLQMDTATGNAAITRIQQKISAITDPETKKRMALGLSYAYEERKKYDTDSSSVIAKDMGNKKAFPESSVTGVLLNYLGKELGIQPEKQKNNNQNGDNRNREGGGRRNRGRNR